MSNTRVYEPQIRARLVTKTHFCEVVILKPRAVLVWYSSHGERVRDLLCQLPRLPPRALQVTASEQTVNNSNGLKHFYLQTKATLPHLLKTSTLRNRAGFDFMPFLRFCSRACPQVVIDSGLVGRKVSRGEKISLPESYITEYTLVYEETLRDKAGFISIPVFRFWERRVCEPLPRKSPTGVPRS